MSKPRIRYDHAARRWSERDIRTLMRGDLPAGLDPTASDEPVGGMPRELQDAEARGSRRRVPFEQPRNDMSLMNSGSFSRRVTSASRTFSSLGEQLQAARMAVVGDGITQRRAVERLQSAALSTYGNEGSGADGGFMVAPEFVGELLQKVTGEESLLSLCDQVQVSSSTIRFPKDESAPWASSGGIRGYWEGEAAAIPQSKPVLEHSTVKLHKITALVPVTDELLEDAPALGSYVQAKAAEVIDFKVTDAIINGSGAGQPLGILNAGHTVSQAAESSQVADTIHGLNLVKMWARMPAAWRGDAVWLIHPDAEPQLNRAGLQIVSADGLAVTGGQLIFRPAGTIEGSPYGALFGRPVIVTQACQQLGDVGDIIFANLRQYAACVRAPGLRADTSIHMWFDQGVTAFRFTLRLGGQPWWSAPLTDRNGSTTRSAFVTLAAR